MNQHLEKAIEFYGDDLQRLLDWHLCYGFVLCRPECLSVGFFTNSENAMSPVQRDEGDTLFITYCAGKMRFCLNQFNKEFKFVAFQRQTKGSSQIRVWDYNKTLNRIK